MTYAELTSLTYADSTLPTRALNRGAVIDRPRARFAPLAGVALYGLSTAAFFLLIVRSPRLDGHEAAAFSSFWFLLYLAAPTLFGPLEIELAKRLAGAELSPRLGRGVARSVVRLAACAAAVTTLAGVGLLFQDRLLGGSPVLAMVLVAAVLGQGAGHMVRGVLVGTGRFDLQGACYAVEGIARLGGAALLYQSSAAITFAGVATVASFAPLAFLPAATRPFRRCGGRRPEAADADGPTGISLSSVGRLAVSFMGLQAVLASPGILSVLVSHRSETALAATLGGVALVCRMPMFALQAVQGVLLRSFAIATSVGDYGALRAHLRRLAAIGAALAFVAGALGFAGTDGITNMLGGRAPVRPVAVGLLFGGGVLACAAVTVQLIVLCVHPRSRGALAWAAGLGVIACAAGIPAGLDVKVALGFACGTAVAFVSSTVSAWRAIAGLQARHSSGA